MVKKRNVFVSMIYRHLCHIDMALETNGNGEHRILPPHNVCMRVNSKAPVNFILRSVPLDLTMTILNRFPSSQLHVELKRPRRVNEQFAVGGCRSMTNELIITSF